jgi:hypothetical protein
MGAASIKVVTRPTAFVTAPENAIERWYSRVFARRS